MFTVTAAAGSVIMLMIMPVTVCNVFIIAKNIVILTRIVFFLITGYAC